MKIMVLCPFTNPKFLRSIICQSAQEYLIKYPISGAKWPGFLTVPRFPCLQNEENMPTSGLLSRLTEFQILSGPD